MKLTEIMVGNADHGDMQLSKPSVNLHDNKSLEKEEEEVRKERRAERGEEEEAGGEGGRKGSGEERKEGVRDGGKEEGRWVNLGSGIQYPTYVNHIGTFTFAKLYVY